MEQLHDGTGLLADAAARDGLLDDEPFVLLDVGASGGIDEGWRAFGDRLVAYGFDPDLVECERQQEKESHLPGDVRYVGAFVGLPPDHPFVRRKPDGAALHHNPWDRLSAPAGVEVRRRHNVGEFDVDERRACNLWTESRLADPDDILVLPDFLRRTGVDDVDFIKVDIDGNDFDVLVSLTNELDRLNVLGLGMEVNYFGSSNDTDHTFHNTDRFMRQQGYELFALTTRRYSSRLMPSRFVWGFPAQTLQGRLFQGDAVYFLDLVAEENREIADRLSPAKLLKLAALFELTGLSDCAAELIITFRSRLEQIVRVDVVLDALVPEPWKGQVSYEEHLARFEANDPAFYGNGP